MGMTKPIRTFLLSLVLLTAWASLSAQTEEPALSVRFTCLAWDGVRAHDLTYRKGDQLEPLRISSSYRSKQYTYQGANPIVFYRGVITLPDGSTQPRPVASATIPEGQREVLLLFLAAAPDQPDGMEYNVVVIDDSDVRFPWGSYCIYNLSAHEIGGIFGSEKFVISGKKSKIVMPDSDDLVDVQIHFSQMIEGQWVPKVNTRWLYRKNARSIVFVTDDLSARNPRLKVKSIDQYQKP
jgi:hypothetical protein